MINVEGVIKKPSVPKQQKAGALFIKLLDVECVCGPDACSD